MGPFSFVSENWLWFVWGAIAVCVVVGYFRVRRQIDRVERAGDQPAPGAKERHVTERDKREHRGVE